jgi:hypothetical protein
LADNYVFVRDASGSPPDYGRLKSKGATPVLNANDPHLEQEVAKARASGVEPAIWIPASTGNDPVAYGKRMAGLVQKYHPAAIIPNVEQQGEGAAGSAWSRSMMAEYGKYVPRGSVKISVAVEANKPQGVWDYKPYLDAGGTVIAESFLGNSGTPTDPDKVRQALIDSGVPADKINVMLRPGQARGKLPGQYSAYTLDDMGGNYDQLDKVYTGNSEGTSPLLAAPVDTASPAGVAGDALAPAPTRVRDADNPAAVAYAQQRLDGLARQGITPARYGLEGLDPTAQWRALSTIVGAQQAIKAGHAADYHVGPGTPQSVADYVNKLLGGAQTPEGPDNGALDPRRNTPDNPRVAGGSTFVPPDSNRAVAAVHSFIQSQGARAPRSAVGGAVRGQITPALVRAVADFRRNPPGNLAPTLSRIGPMQRAIAVSAAVRHLHELIPHISPTRRTQ